MFGEVPKAAVESFLLPPLTATAAEEVTGAAEDPIDGDLRIRSLCGSLADASMLIAKVVLLRMVTHRNGVEAGLGC